MYDFKTFTFGKGAHTTRQQGLCVMEAVSYIAGEPHSDHPVCASPILSTFLRSWNDSIEDDARRTELLSPFVFRLVGTKASPEIELQRSWMCFDWLMRECLPAFLDLTPSLLPHAKLLRGLPELNASNLDIAIPILKAADSAARSAAYSAAYSAARSAARSAAYSAADSAAYSAARSAAYSAADSAAYSAADSAARSAARSAAYSAAYSAARSAAYSAAYSALKPTVEKLQESASQLVDRMIRLTEPQEADVTARVREKVENT